MKIIHSKVGPVHTNCYIVYDENSKQAVIIDPGENANMLLENILENDLQLKYILLTHAHFDHIIAVSKIQEKTNAQVLIHKKEIPSLSKQAVTKHFGGYIRGEYEPPKDVIPATEGTQVEFGDLKAKFIHTPGHTVGSCVIQIGNAWFTGDTLFAGECGRCDLPGGNFDQMLTSLKKLAEIEGNYDVFPGHEQFSTLNEERKYNRYIKEALAR